MAIWIRWDHSIFKKNYCILEKNYLDDLSVSVTGVSGLTAASMTSGGEDKTRLLGSVGAQYYLTKDQRIEAKFMYEQLRYNDADYKTAYVNYTIGF